MSEFSNGINPSEFEIKKSILPPAQEAVSTSEQPKTPQELTNERIQKLEEIASQPDFDDEKTSSALRVYDFLQHENDFPTKKKWNKYLKDIDDWKLYHQLNSDWQELTPRELENKEGGLTFYNALTEWVRKNESTNKKIIEKIFSSKQKDWSQFQTIEKWQEEFNQHPEWKGLNRNEIKKFEGGDNFCQSFNKWIQKETKNLPPEERQNKSILLRETILVPKNRDWTQFNTIEQWQEEFNQHPEWQGSKILEKTTFLKAFGSWVNKETKDLLKDEKRTKITELKKDIAPTTKEWSQFTTIEQWQEYFNQHPEWQGLSVNEVRDLGGQNFNTAFNKWLNKKTKNLSPEKSQNEKIKLKEIIYTSQKTDWTQFNTIEQWQEEFNQHPEWQGSKKSGELNNFYQKFCFWTNEQAKNLPIDKQKQFTRQLREIIFPIESQNWSKFNTIEQWQEYFNQHPEWKGFSSAEIQSNKEGVRKPYNGLNYWISKQTKEVQEQANKILIEKIFSSKQKDWSQFQTIEKWQEYFNQHPEWKGLSIGKIDKDNERSKFYNAFSKWTHKEVQNINGENTESIRKKLTEKIFSPKHSDWSQFDTIEKWQEYFNQHPEWQDKNFKTIEKLDRGSSFLQAFNFWIKKKTENLNKDEREIIKKELREKILNRKQSKSTNFKINNNQNLETNTFITQPQQIDLSKTDIVKLKNLPEIIIPKNPGKTIIFDDKEDINFSDGFTLGNVETTSIKTNGNSNGFNNIRYSISVDNLTDSQRLRLLTGREDQNPELYAKNIGQLATYVVHRGEIGFLLDLFSQNKLDFPKIIADFGAGPSTAYSAYEQLTPTIEEYGFSKPQIIDVEKNDEMSKFGKNPNKIEGDITQKISLDDQTVDMVQSTFVIHHFKSSEIYKTLSEANRVTKNGGYLSLICSRPFSQSFLDGVENLGYQVITDHGAVLTPNNQMIAALSQEFDSETAKRFQNRFNSSFILFAKKNTDVNEINQLPSLEAFTFDQVKKTTRERKPILDLKNYDIETSPLTENIERITDSIIYQLHQLEVSPLRQEGGLIPGGNEIRSSYEIFNYNLNSIQSLYDKIYNKIKNQFNTLNPEQIDQFNQLKEQLRTVKEYKKYFYQRHIH